MSFNNPTVAYVRYTERSNGTGIAQVYIAQGNVHLFTPALRRLTGRPIDPELEAYREAKNKLSIYARRADEYRSYPDRDPFAFVSTEMTRDEFRILVRALRDIKRLEVKQKGDTMGVDDVLDSIVARLTPLGNHQNS